jgi:hypothetical protein
LEAEHGEGHELDEGFGAAVAKAGDHAGLDEGRGDGDECGLKKERE